MKHTIGAYMEIIAMYAPGFKERRKIMKKFTNKEIMDIMYEEHPKFSAKLARKFAAIDNAIEEFEGANTEYMFIHGFRTGYKAGYNDGKGEKA